MVPDSAEDERDQRHCPFCSLPILWSTDVCPACGEWINPDNEEERLAAGR